MLTYFKTTRNKVECLMCPKCAGILNSVLIKLINYTNAVKFPPMVGECEKCKFNYDHTKLRHEYSIILGKLCGYDPKDLIRDARNCPEPLVFPIVSGKEKKIIMLEVILCIIRCGDNLKYSSVLEDTVQDKLKQVMVISMYIVLTYEHKYKHQF